VNRDVKGYFDAVPADKRAYIEKLHALILKQFSQAEVVISYGILMYRVKQGWVGLGCWKGGVSLYTSGTHHLEEFKARHPGVKCGKGSINLKLGEALPLNDLKQVIRHAMEQPKPE